MAPPEDVSKSAKRKRSATPPGSQEPTQRAGVVSRRRRPTVDRAVYLERTRKWMEEAPIREAKEKAEEQRRHDLGQIGRLEEDGRKLQELIEADPMAEVWLEASRSLYGLCRAPDCLFVEDEPSQDPGSSRHIQTEFRIRVNGERDPYYRTSRRFYHYHCFDVMVDVSTLIPDKFKLDWSTFDWQIIVTEWYKHKCQINHEDFSDFLVKFCAYREKCIEWAREGDNRSWLDAPWPAPPQNYITDAETEAMSITDVLELTETSETRKPSVLIASEIDRKFPHELSRAVIVNEPTLNLLIFMDTHSNLH